MSEEIIKKKVINLNVTDNCFERAKKMLICAGVIDRTGLSQRMAEVIEAYRVMDINQPKKDR